MANCAISIKGSDIITHFITDCIQSNRDFKGSNISLYGLKDRLFDVTWTTTIPTPIFDSVGNIIGYNKKVSDLVRANEHNGIVVDDYEGVDRVTKDKIKKKYTIEDEIKILRLKLTGDSKLFDEYNKFVNDTVNEAKLFKSTLKLKLEE